MDQIEAFSQILQFLLIDAPAPYFEHLEILTEEYAEETWENYLEEQQKLFKQVNKMGLE